MSPTEFILETDTLTKRFGNLTAVDGLSLHVKAGEIYGFLGPNGAGKTTTIRMLCGQLPPDSGQVIFNHKPVTNWDGNLRASIGYASQEIAVWSSLTCYEQLCFMASMYDMKTSERKQRATELMKALGLEEKRNSQAHNLSGGMQRRLHVALAMVHRPQILILDEPESGLDPQSRAMVRDYIRTLTDQCTIILTTHNMDEAERLANQIAIIDHGKLLRTGTPKELKDSIGQGDTIEINLNGGKSQESEIKAVITSRLPDLSFQIQEGSLTVHALHAPDLLPDLLGALETCSIHPKEIHIRQNTLEDVFLQLTGRRLRE
ncbi:MAG TPA: ABC transporter ATP-binding protein [Longilinea sp.]|nr:ABC transporter ATP-binding protein [Longilinea sp.]